MQGVSISLGPAMHGSGAPIGVGSPMHGAEGVYRPGLPAGCRVFCCHLVAVGYDNTPVRGKQLAHAFQLADSGKRTGAVGRGTSRDAQ